MIGLIGAMRIEIEILIKEMQDSTTTECGRMAFHVGKLYDIDTVLCVCGPGKVNAAVCTDTLIHLFHPDCVINLGVAGAVGSKLNIGDIVIADSCVQHDMDTTALGDPLGLISGLGIVDLPCDKALGDKLAWAALRIDGLNVYRGIIATGDQFVSSKEMKRKIASAFDCLACEMEGAAVVQTCYMHCMPVSVIRSISDKADGTANKDFDNYALLAAQRSMALIMELFKSLCAENIHAINTF